MRKSSTALGLICLIAIVAAAGAAGAAEKALWLRYPAISPDGETIVFSYRGDLWKVAAGGGQAVQLTVHAGHDFMPVWSPDSSKVAFASDRYGNNDIYVMSATGGKATRLTFHSADDFPTSFTADGASVLFSSGRLDSQDCAQYPTRRAQPELYSVSLEGGMPLQVFTTPAVYAVWDSAGERLAYSDNKGYEGPWRKHDDSSFARDVWIFDAESGQHSRLTEFGADDRQPVWGPDDDALYFLSERDGTFNVWTLSLDTGAQPAQITTFDTHPVRFLSISENGDLCYTWDGSIYVQPAGDSEGRELEITVPADSRHNEVEYIDVAKDITDFDLSPDGKELAFVARGEVFVTSSDHGDTKRITDTPEQERSVSFSPDGRSLLYASERGGSWNLYRTDLTDKDEPSFFNATAFKENPVLVTELETFQPYFSPDGKEVAYLEERTALKVLNLESGISRTILPVDVNYSYIDGDQWYEWSPDGKWFLVEFLSPTRWSSEVGLISSSGDGELANLTRSGYEDSWPRWAFKGEAVFWLTDRHGERRQSGWPAHLDVYTSFLTRDAWDRFHLSEAEIEQLKEKEEKDKKDKEKGEKDDEDGKKKGKKDDTKDEEEKDDEIELPDPVDIQLEGIEDRTIRMTLHSADLDDAQITPDGEKVLYLAAFEKGYDLWVYEPRKKEAKLLAKLKADDTRGMRLDKEGKKLYVLADRSLKEVEIDSGKVKPVALAAKMDLNAAAERDYMFEHAWRQTREKFYVEDMNGVDWESYKTAYVRFLPYIDNNNDFCELISELQGELNGSHLGCRYRPQREGADATATLAFFPDPEHDGAGIEVAEIIDGGPLQSAETKVRVGTVIEAIDGHEIAADENWYPLLNHKAGVLVRLSLFDPTTGKRWQETVKPISQRAESELLYLRWVRSRRAEVTRLSDGRLGYAHIRSMSDRGFREIFEEVFGKSVDKEGIVLDTRFNGGGNLVEALTIFLTGEVYSRALPRGQKIGVQPTNRWTKPSIVVMNEGNYSDAHCFPAAYTALGIGKMVGMPVPGTCTAVWWERLQDRSLVFGIPQVGYIDNEGEMMENNHLAPDHQIDNDPALEAAGQDQQLEKAVEVLLAGM
ncbi:MAG: PD40 domain-containing protein [Acidobacteria bacterium]|nr:PD40 domain-containing protein [Acidobacteriota bacterium]